MEFSLIFFMALKKLEFLFHHVFLVVLKYFCMYICAQMYLSIVPNAGVFRQSGKLVLIPVLFGIKTVYSIFKFINHV